MQLSQSVKLKQKQSLVMTPQLQQAIKLLQLSNLELSQHLQEQVDENPFLELTELEENGSLAISEKKESIPSNKETTDLSELKESNALADDPTENNDFENRFDQAVVDGPRALNGGKSFEGDFDLINNVSLNEGFYTVLFRQLNLTIEDPKERLIAGHFINSLEPTGWIGKSVEEVAVDSGSNVIDAKKVLKKLQTFEPTGLLPEIYQIVYVFNSRSQGK